MSQSKEEKTFVPKDINNIFGLLDVKTIGTIASYLSVPDELNAIRSSITTYNLFKPHLHLLSIKARDCVAQGNLETLKAIAKKRPFVIIPKRKCH
ncbi:MAG: hypothetical protein QM652_00585 [Legionella sp.]|uniref:hypothetical protein n=1 Tax=Legionella sp. TaxID=459 RepID=UPI0039E6D4F0